MDWSVINFDWNRARAFLVTAEEGSFSAGARALGVAQPTLGRQVSALEQELGVTLFERLGQGLALTDAGQQLKQHVQSMADAASRFSLSASGQNTQLDGRVVLAVSELEAVFLLPPVIEQV
ncbi:LysR family transcriptional regulator, partial [bacterium]|nr:LysR family transcriptional regulator [bacterium]